MFAWNTIQKKAVEDYQRDLMREAEQFRLAQQAQANQPNSPYYAPLLAELGRRMVELGQRLEQQHGASNSLSSEEAPAK